MSESPSLSTPTAPTAQRTGPAVVAGPALPRYDGQGPVLSVYLGLSVAPEGRGGELGLRWRALRGLLTEQGAGEDPLRLLDERVAACEPSPRTLVAFVRGDRLESEELEDCDAPDAALCGPVPLAVPLLRWRGEWVPYVVASVDRTGADLAAHLGAGPAVAERVVVGPDDEVERNAPGGWSQLRYQHRAEDSWAHNAAVVAEHVARMVADVRAQLVLTAGDVRAVQELTDHLSEPVRNLQEHVTSGLEQAGPGRVRLPRATVVRHVHAAARRARSRVLAELDQAAGSRHLETGLQACAGALAVGSVRHLVVVDRPGDERQAWAEAEPLEVEPVDVAAADVPRRLVPLREAMVRAAAAQSADVTVVRPEEADLPDGFAALLRF